MEKLKNAQRVVDFGRIRPDSESGSGNNVTRRRRNLGDHEGDHNNGDDGEGGTEVAPDASAQHSPSGGGITTRSNHRLGTRRSINNNNNNNNKKRAKSSNTIESTSSPNNDNFKSDSRHTSQENGEREEGGKQIGAHPDSGMANERLEGTEGTTGKVSSDDDDCGEINIVDDSAIVNETVNSDGNDHQSGSGGGSRCSSRSSILSPGREDDEKKEVWKSVNSQNSEDCHVEDMPRDLKTKSQLPRPATNSSQSIHNNNNGSEKSCSSPSSASSSVSSSPLRGDSASLSAALSSPITNTNSNNNKKSNKSSHECRQMRCNRSCAGGDGNNVAGTESLGTSHNQSSNSNNNNKNSGSSSNNNNNNNNNKAVEKLRMAPMGFMNNLPYMGELTFDTRPRRGRKPKKADICHLISKNYGIHFPNSSQNVIPTTTTTSSYTSSSSPATSSPRVSTFTSSCIPAGSASTGVSGSSKSAKNKPTSTLPNPRRNHSHANLQKQQQQQQHLTNNSNPSFHPNDGKKFNQNLLNNPNFMPTINWTHHVPPDLLPLASVHPAAAAVALLQNSPKRNAAFKKISSLQAPYRQFHEQLQQQQQEQFQSYSRLSSSGQDNKRHGEVRNSDEPLNLCVRDKGSPPPPHNINPLDFLAIPSGFDSPGKPSSTTLFGNFNLKHGGNSGGNRAVKSQSQVKRGGGVKRGGTLVPDLVTDDQNLVNLNIQLNLSASKLANYVNSANNNRPLSFGSNAFGGALDASRLSSMQNSSGGGRSVAKSKRKRATVTGFSPNSTGGHGPGGMTLSSLGGHQGLNDGLHHHNPHNPFGHGQSMNHSAMDTSGSTFPHGSSNAAEVSICKFKFTGGAKPSLQEKKMLSLDSGGNFRFYSDKGCGPALSGSKGNSGSSLHHHQLKDDPSPTGESISATSAHGLPKSAKSMSMCMPVPSPAPSLSTCSVVVPEIHSPSLPPIMSPADLECSSSSDGPPSSSASSSMMMASTKDLSGHLQSHQHHNVGGSSGTSSSGNKLKMKRKRRTRKSLMREKLEKTFKEKGFLIQTQQLESAEGATYCKFRQLRKFTRYLFRSWKDYLPDNLKEANSAGQTDELTPVNNNNSSAQGSLGTQPISSSAADLLESMEQAQDEPPSHEDNTTEEGRSCCETPDNLTLSPAGGPNHVDENEDEDGDELDDKEEEDEEEDEDEEDIGA